MGKAKILRLCNEIEMLMVEIYNTGHTMQNCDYEAVNKRLKEVVAEITAPPKTNGDRIRQMTDEELADFITDIPNKCGAISCLECNFNLYDKGCAAYSKKAAVIWLKQEVQKDAES